MTRLSILAQFPIRSGVTAADAVREMLEFARLADRHGIYLYWLAEQHSSGRLVGLTPEILVGHIATETKELRVGSGGVMPSHYSALKVAENFRMLEAFHPGRIGLGIGRAPGSDLLTSVAPAHGPGRSASTNFQHRYATSSNFSMARCRPNIGSCGGCAHMSCSPKSSSLNRVNRDADGYYLL